MKVRLLISTALMSACSLAHAMEKNKPNTSAIFEQLGINPSYDKLLRYKPIVFCPHKYIEPVQVAPKYVAPVHVPSQSPQEKPKRMIKRSESFDDFKSIVVAEARKLTENQVLIIRSALSRKQDSQD